jgi:hypothetical protein
MAGVAGTLAFGCSSSSSNPGTPDEGGVGSPDAKKEATTSSSGDEGGGDEAGVCAALSSVGSFTPTYKPAAAHQDACTQGNIDNFRTFCLGTGDANACQSFLATTAGKTCAQCILTQPTAAALGPLIDHTSQGFVSLNTAGCLQIAQGNDTCAKAISALSQCDDAACVNCKVTDDASLQALNDCTNVADQAACAQYTGPAGCADQAAEAGTAGQCFAGNDFTSGYNSIVPIFCLKADDGGITDAADGG